MKRLHLVLIVPCVLLSLSVFAEQFPIKRQTQGEIDFVSCGVGVDDWKLRRFDYNLSLLFSMRRSGEYLSGVTVRITDSDGNTVLETLSDGPRLFAKLKPGSYLVTVEGNGQAMQKKATVGDNEMTSLSITWLTEKGD